MKVNNLPNITQLISGRAGIKTNTIVQIQISTLFHGVTLPLMVIAGVGSVTDQGSYLQCSEKSITASVEMTPPIGCSQPATERGRDTKVNLFLGEKVLTHLTTNIVFKALTALLNLP